MSDVAVPSKFVKRPVVIDAYQLTEGGSFERAAAWINSEGGNASATFLYLLINTLEGTMEAGSGWWVIKGVKGEFYPCEPEIFELTYSKADA